MKKVLLFAAMIMLTAVVFAAGDKKAVVDSLLKDTTVQQAIVDAAINSAEKTPEAGANWIQWVMWIGGLLYAIVGIFASHLPSKGNLWYLRLVPIFFKFLGQYVIFPENKKKDGGNHPI